MTMTMKNICLSAWWVNSYSQSASTLIAGKCKGPGAVFGPEELKSLVSVALPPPIKI